MGVTLGMSIFVVTHKIRSESSFIFIFYGLKSAVSTVYNEYVSLRFAEDKFNTYSMEIVSNSTCLSF